MKFTFNKSLASVAVLSIALTGCFPTESNDDDNDEGVVDKTTKASVDASAGSKVYIDLSTGTAVTESDDWHIAYQKYVGFTSNGGVSGTGAVEGCAAHLYDQLFDSEGDAIGSEFLALSTESTLADYEAVTATTCSTFETDSVDTYIEMGDWLEADYSMGAPVYSASTEDSNLWIVRSASGDKYARVKVSEVTYAGGSPGTRELKLTSELFDSGVFQSAAESPTLDFNTETAYWDLETNTVVTASDDWDLSVTRNGYSWDIAVNAGVSGSGSGGIGYFYTSAFAPTGYEASTVTDPSDTDQVASYKQDSSTGFLSEPGNYGALQYGAFGGHAMTPTYTTYVIKDGDDMFKFQLLNNYGEAGDLSSGNLYFRYSAL